VCVTPVETIDKAIALAGRPEVTLCSFGDMLRVPGSEGDLLAARSRGGDVRIVYGPLDAVALAEKLPEREVVFLAVGFETTAPANALAVLRARALGLDNFSILCAQVLVPPAMEAVLACPESRVEGFLAAGHVCAVMGYAEYEPFVQRHRVPVVVTGFEPLDILQGVFLCVKQLEEGRAEVENQYTRAVTREGNATARETIDEVFETVPRAWRGLGVLAASGLGLRETYRRYDAEARFDMGNVRGVESEACIAAEILRGLKRPPDCAAFGKDCTPGSPLGALMVSSEGACAAYYRYRR
jgi:hydrogenase expression/formation protein HypD